MAMADPTLTIRNLLKNNWDNTNTSLSSDPAIHTGWIDREASSPQVTVTSAEESPISIGQSPFSGIVPDGSGPTQEIGGTVMIDCWSSREMESSVNPKQLTFEFSEEVKRILKGNLTSATDLRYIGYQGRRFMTDPDAEPVVFRYSVTAWYVYQERP